MGRTIIKSAASKLSFEGTENDDVENHSAKSDGSLVVKESREKYLCNLSTHR